MPADFRSVAHRPWPIPAQPWAMAMNWHDLLFMHWPVPADSLRPFIPAGLEIDLHPDSTGRPTAWLGIVPFTMTGIRARFTPAIPGLSAFHELNVRTYVRPRPSPQPTLAPLQRGELVEALRDRRGVSFSTANLDDGAGVWFFSLDAAHSLAVTVARATFHLHYFNARMTLRHDRDSVVYSATRTHRNAAPARFEATYRPTAPPAPSRPGTLEHWLTERYCLYSASPTRLYRADIHHAPWPLQPAECVVRTNTMAAQLNLTLPDTPPLLHFARRIDVAAWLPQRVGSVPSPVALRG